ncbi:ubiquinol-cytochrome C chaperone, partial [bacterium]|nr:ubiquinol-cytochrome C chaperone [bacterium]
RLSAYHGALAADGDEALDVALDNNLYGTVIKAPPTRRADMIVYLRRELAGLAAQPLENVLAGRVEFGPVVAAGMEDQRHERD